MAEDATQLQKVQNAIDKILEFLLPVLPLANAHNTDFYTLNYWVRLLQSDIARQLLELSQEDLIRLPSADIQKKTSLGSSVQNSSRSDDRPDCTSHENIVGAPTVKELNNRTQDNRSDNLNECASETFSPLHGLREGKEIINTASQEGDVLGQHHKPENSKINRSVNVSSEKKRSVETPDSYSMDSSEVQMIGHPTGNNEHFCFKGKVEVLKPDWQHGNLYSFLKHAKAATLPRLGVLSNTEKALTQIGIPEMSASEFHIDSFMSEKKGHEVHRMALLCSTLSTNFDTEGVIDIGSGKGYLATELGFQHGVKVLGVDCSIVNTSGAENRKQKLGKYWNGLVRKARKEKEGTNVEDKTNLTVGASKNNSNSESEVLNTKRDIENPCLTQNQLLHGSVGNNKNRQMSNHDQSKISLDHVSRAEQSKDELKSTFYSVTEYVTKDTDLTKLFREVYKTSHEDSISTKCQQGKGEPIYTQAVNEMNNPQVYGDCSFENEHENDIGYKTNTENTAPDHKKGQFLLTGLHTCGNLASSTLNIFVNNPAVKAVCNVGCCYHLVEEKFVPSHEVTNENADCNFPLSEFLKGKRCQLGRNARMLACQAAERITAENKLPDNSLFYRAVLQVILQDITGETRNDWHIGKLAKKSKNFTDYVQKSLRKLKINHEISGHEISLYLSKYAHFEKHLHCYYQLRAVLAASIEGLLLLDRLCYLLEQPGVQHAHLVQLFDPVKSPRCYAIIAVK